MLPRLEAQEQLRAATTGSLAAGTLTPEASARLLEDLGAQASGEAPAPSEMEQAIRAIRPEDTEALGMSLADWLDQPERADG